MRFSLIGGLLVTIAAGILGCWLERRPPRADDLVDLAEFGALVSLGFFVTLLVRSALVKVVDRVLDATLGRQIEKRRQAPHRGEDFDAADPSETSNPSPR